MRSYGPLVSATGLYRDSVKLERAKFRQELKDRTHDELVGLGREITFLTQEGATIQEIEQAMGSKSRTLIYEAKRAYAASNQPAQPNQPEPEAPSEEYKLELDDFVVYVHWANNKHEELVLNEQGTVFSSPEDWKGLDKTREQRRLYARIIAEAEALANA